MRLTGISPEFYEPFRNYALGAASRSPHTFNGYLKQLRHLERLSWVRDKFLLCAYTSLRLSDADRLVPEHVQGDLRMRAGKTEVVCHVPLVDDDVLQPQALLARYAPLGLSTYLPWVRDPCPWCRSWLASRACTWVCTWGAKPLLPSRFTRACRARR